MTEKTKNYSNTTLIIIIGLLYGVVQWFIIRSINGIDKKFDNFDTKVDLITAGMNLNSKDISNINIDISYLKKNVEKNTKKLETNYVRLP